LRRFRVSGSEEADYWSLAITWILGVPLAVWSVGAALDRALLAEHGSLAGGQVTVGMGSRQETTPGEPRLPCLLAQDEVSPRQTHHGGRGNLERNNTAGVPPR
jgi:hypothetical protein